MGEWVVGGWCWRLLAAGCCGAAVHVFVVCAATDDAKPCLSMSMPMPMPCLLQIRLLRNSRYVPSTVAGMANRNQPPLSGPLALCPSNPVSTCVVTIATYIYGRRHHAAPATTPPPCSPLSLCTLNRRAERVHGCTSRSRDADMITWCASNVQVLRTAMQNDPGAPRRSGETMDRREHQPGDNSSSSNSKSCWDRG